MTSIEFYADPKNDPAYVECQEQLTDLGITLGGDETLENLVEMLQHLVGDFV